MPQVRINDEIFKYFQDKAEREDRTVGVQINRDLLALSEEELNKKRGQIDVE